MLDSSEQPHRLSPYSPTVQTRVVGRPAHVAASFMLEGEKTWVHQEMVLAQEQMRTAMDMFSADEYEFTMNAFHAGIRRSLYASAVSYMSYSTC